MRPETPKEFMRRYRRITSHLIAESLGYATPSTAARIGLDGLYDRENYCEWLYSCYGKSARRALQKAIRGRHCHNGYLADYRQARKLVGHALETGEEPLLASWF